MKPETVVRWHRAELPSLLALAIATRPSWSTTDRRELARADSSDGDREGGVGSAEDPRRAARARLHCVGANGLALPAAQACGPRRDQPLLTFLRNHRDAIAATDFFVVPTVTFRGAYVWFAIDHARRRILHCDATDAPTAAWVVPAATRGVRARRDASPLDLRSRFDLLHAGRVDIAGLLVEGRTAHPRGDESDRCFRARHPSLQSDNAEVPHARL